MDGITVVRLKFPFSFCVEKFSRKRKNHGLKVIGTFSSVSQYFKIIDTMIPFVLKKRVPETSRYLRKFLFSSVVCRSLFVKRLPKPTTKVLVNFFLSITIMLLYVFSLAHYKSDCLLNNLCKKLLVSLFLLLIFNHSFGCCCFSCSTKV